MEMQDNRGKIISLEFEDIDYFDIVQLDCDGNPFIVTEINYGTDTTPCNIHIRNLKDGSMEHIINYTDDGGFFGGSTFSERFKFPNFKKLNATLIIED